MVVRLLRYTLTQGYINFHRPLQRKKGSIHEVDDITVSVHLPVHKCLFQCLVKYKYWTDDCTNPSASFSNSCPTFVVSNEIHLNMI